MNRFGGALSAEMDLEVAVTRCAREVALTIENHIPDLAVFFLSHEHHTGFADAARLVKQATGANVVLGCAGETVIGGAREVEAGPAFSLWVAHLPDAKVTPFRLQRPQNSADVITGSMPKIDSILPTASSSPKSSTYR